MISHTALTDRDQEDHPAYGPLSQPNAWGGHNTFSAGLVAAKVGVPSAPPPASTYITVLDLSPPAGLAGLSVNIGAGPVSPGTNIIGVGGYALARHASTIASLGLDFWAGLQSVDLAASYGCRAGLFALGSGRTLAAGYCFHAPSPLHVLATITTLYGFSLGGAAGVPAFRPFYDPTPPNAAYHSIMPATLQLFSVTPSFGGGVGVLGVANATTVPTSNPVGGGVFYAQGGALKWRGSGGTITTIAPA